MKVDLRTAVLIRRRLEQAALGIINETSNRPTSQAARVKRIMAWLGGGGRILTAPYVLGERLPDWNQGTLSRWGGYASKSQTHSKGLSTTP